MIQKICSLQTIGSFRDYRVEGNVAFNNHTLIYAENGSGKTTLSAVLRSLTGNQPELIHKRLSTNDGGQTQAAIILSSDSGKRSTHTFGQNGWSSALPNIEIFDVHFVHENVYSGFDFGDDHRKQLYNFVLGSQGIEYQKQIDENKQQKSRLKEEIETCEIQIVQNVQFGLTKEILKEFCNLDVLPSEIEQDIAAAQQSLELAKSQKSLLILPKLKSLQLPRMFASIDFDAIIKDVELTSTMMQDEVLQTFLDNHCQALSESGIQQPEMWLQDGFQHVQHQKIIRPNDMTCPFCQQALNDNREILRAYTLRFDKDFKSLLQRLNAYALTLQGFHTDIMQPLKQVTESNHPSINAWQDYLHNADNLPEFTHQELPYLQSIVQQVLTIVQNKQQNPSESFDSAAIQDFQTVVGQMKNGINSYNLAIGNFNALIEERRKGIKTEEQARQELERLQRMQKRFEPAIRQLCDARKDKENKLNQFEQAYTKLGKEQAQNAQEFFQKYADRINYYLCEVFRTPFRIQDVAHVAPKGKATQSKVGYQLTIDGENIAFDAAQMRSAKDCLSEGDKNTIALAFFLAKLDNDNNLHNKTIVFDDPLSSFDRNRRGRTAEQLIALGQRVHQIVVLSHNEHFLHDLKQRIETRNLQILQIRRLPHSSVLEAFADFDEMFTDRYFKELKELEEYIQDPQRPSQDRVLGLIRTVLEAAIKHRFHRQIMQHSQQGNQTFDSLIRLMEAEETITFKRDKQEVLSKLKALNLISRPLHHGSSSNGNVLAPTQEEISGWVRDVFDLIDNNL